MPTNDNVYWPKRSELGKYTTLEEIETDHLVQTTVVPEPVPFGYLFEEWQLMKQQVQEGDQLQYFRGELGDGLALIRFGEIITWIGCGIPRHKRN